MEKIYQRADTCLVPGTLKFSLNHPSRQKARPVVPPDELESLVRSLEDLDERKSLNGLDPSLIAPCGYRVAVNGCGDPVQIPRHTIVVPVRNAAGRITALHDPDMRWFTQAQIHITNLGRSEWTRQIEVFADTVIADVESIRRNIAATALNGLRWRDLERLVAHLPVRLVSGEMEVAA